MTAIKTHEFVDEAVKSLQEVPGSQRLVESVRLLGTIDAGEERSVLEQLAKAYDNAKVRKQGGDADQIAYAITVLVSKGLKLPIRPAISEIT